MDRKIDSKLLFLILLIFILQFVAVSALQNESVDYIRDNSKQKALDIGKQIEIYLKLNPQKTLKDLQDDPYFQEIAVQRIGQTGYTILIDADSMVIKFHSESSMIGFDSIAAELDFPDLYKIVYDARLGNDSEGFYEWVEPDGKKTKKYIYITSLEGHTSDNKKLLLGVTYYLNDIEPTTVTELIDEDNSIFSKINVPFLMMSLFSIIVYIFFLLSSELKEGNNETIHYFKGMLTVGLISSVMDIIRLNFYDIQLVFFAYKILFLMVHIFIVYFAVLIFSVVKIKFKKLYFYLYFSASAIITLFTDLIIKEPHFNQGNVAITPGMLFSYMWLVILLFTIVALFILIVKIKENKDAKFFVPIALMNLVILGSMILTEATQKRMPWVQISAPLIIALVLGIALFKLNYLKQKKNIVILLMVLAVFVVVGMFVLNSNQTSNEIKNQAIISLIEEQNVLGQELVKDIKHDIDIIEKDIEVTSNNPDIISNNQGLEQRALNRMYDRLDDFVSSVSLLEINGTILSRTPYIQDFRKDHENYLNKPGIKEGINSGRLTYSNIFVNSLNKTTFSLVLPIKVNLQQKYLLRINVDLEKILSRYLEPTRSKKSGHSFFVIQDVMHISSGETLQAKEEIIDSLSQGVGKTIAGKFYENDDRNYILTFIPVKVGIEYWGIGVVTPEEEAYKSQSKRLREIWIFTFIFMIVTSLVGIVTGILLTRSLRQEVQDKTNEIKAFNVQLEEIVKQRTEELKLKSIELRHLNKNLENEVNKKTKQLNAKLLKEERTKKKINKVNIILAKKEKELAKNNKDLKKRTSELISTNKILYNAEEKLLNFNKKLENKVQKRTVDLEKALKKLKRKDEAKDNFLSNISHDLRTPMTSVKSYIQLLSSGAFGDVNKKQMDALSIIIASADQQIHLINNLLEVTRYESGRTRMNFTKNNLNKSIEIVLAEFYAQLKQNNGKINYKKSKEIEFVFDDDKIRHVFRNFIGNSIKYRSKKKLIIDIIIKKKKNDIILTIKDNGMGIDKENLKHIFDKFYQVDQIRPQEIKGTGLGLSIVHNIIKAHKGTIKVTSEENKGTMFEITLPLKH